MRRQHADWKAYNRQLLDHLMPREAHILRRRAEENETQRAIAQSLGIKRERVRQIERRALKKMAKMQEAS